jgi:NAD(P)-dependent dehydrogenase (short-subunit alcohol dehydrogenase family)
MQNDLTGKIALVTGASRGIGAAVARKLAGAGAHVILVARTVGGLEEIDDMIRADGGMASLVPLDLKDGAAIDRLGGIVAERWGKLDILVANAGILGVLGPLGHLKPKVWDDLMAINVTANWRLIRSFDPLLRASTAGRAVFVTSSVAQNIKAYWGGYAVSKAALETMAKTYAAEVGTSNLKVNIIDPGRTRTAMRAAAMPGEDPASLPKPDEVAEIFLDVCSENFQGNGQIIRYTDWRAAR